MSEAVVITGLGLATSLGFGLRHNWEQLAAGKSAIAALDPGRFPFPLPLPVRIGAMVPREKLADCIRAAVPRAVWNTSAEVCHLWLLVALEALAMAGLPAPTQLPYPKTPSPPVEPGLAPAERVGIFVGNGAGAASFTEQEYANVYTAEKPHLRDISRMAVPKYMMSSLAGQLSILIGARGPAVTVNTACSSGATALALALDALRLGRVDRAVAGGAELPVAGAVLKGFANLGALSARNDLGPAASRPFDAARDGFVLGEGAACMVLERAETARARGARPVARLAGSSTTSEAYHLLSPREHGEAMAACMREALRDADVRPENVRHVYAHGTGTLLNDRCEAEALRDVLAGRPTVSATKALLGHTIGAAGAIDAVLAAFGAADGQAVPCRTLDAPDPECAIHPARAVKLDAVGPDGPQAYLVNSFAFGGHNATLILTPCP